MQIFRYIAILCGLQLASCISLINCAISAEEIRLIASVDKSVLSINDTINLTLTVSGSQDTAQPQLSDLEGFSLIFGPSISTRTSIVNGVVSISTGFTYVLKPVSVGKYIIGEARLNHNGQVYKSDPINIEVVPDATHPGSQKDAAELDLKNRIFVEFVTDKKEAYIYEQVIASFKLFFQRGLPITDLEYTEPEIRNFIKENLGEQRQYEEMRNGIIYNVIELRTALFPVVSGELQIHPARLKCNLILRSNQRGSHSIFDDPFSDSVFDEFFRRAQNKYPITMESQPFVLTVRPLPEEGRPDDFNGAVGAYSLEVDAKPTNLAVGDPITLTMNVKGAGNISTISEPALSLLNNDDFKVYPSETRLTITDRNAGIKGEKLFSKVMEPQHTNITQTPVVSFSFFDPALNTYQTIKYDPVPIKVEATKVEIPVQLYAGDVNLSREEAQIITKDILPIMTNPTYLTNQGRYLYKSPALFPIFFVPLGALIASIFAQRRRHRLKTDTGYVRNRRARMLARSGLGEIKDLVGSAAPEGFYSMLSRTLLQYLADKLHITAASISTINIAVLLDSRNASKENIDRLVKLLELCDYGRFSRDEGTRERMCEALDTAEDMVVSLEREMR